MGDVAIDFQAVFGGIYDALADRVVCDNYLNQEEELINFIEEQVDIRGDAIENEIGTYACLGSYDSLRGTEKLSVGIVLEEGQEMYFLKNGKDRKENGIGIIIVVISFLIVIFIVGFWFGKQKGLNEKEDGVYGKTLEEADENENLGDIAEETELLKGEKEESVEVWSQEKLNEMLITSEELEERVSEKVLNEIFAEYGEWQDYYEVDFDNDGKKDIVVSNGAGMGNMGYSYRFFYRNEGNGIYNMTFGLSNTMSISKPLNFNGKNYWIQVRSNGNVNPGFDYDYDECNIYYFENGHPIELASLTFDPMIVNSILCGEMDKDELEVDVAVKKKFINDFINMSYGPW